MVTHLMDPEVRERIEKLEKLCLARQATVGFAESCTGGLLSSWVCTHSGASKFYRGGVVSYARTVKTDVLNVPLPLIQVHGEVSFPVAVAMARGARKALKCDWSVSVTGIAGPNGGSLEKPVGTVVFAVVGPSFEYGIHKHFAANQGREDIQRQAAFFAFDFLLSAMR